MPRDRPALTPDRAPGPGARRGPAAIPLLPAVATVAAVGAAVLLVAQFLPLYHTYVTGNGRAIGSGSVGSAHAWALAVVAALAALLAGLVPIARSRVALLGILLLGVLSVVIALTRDLSDARAHGIRLVGSSYVSATNTVAAGLYLELAGGLLLLIASVGGFLLWAPDNFPAQPAASGSPRRRRSEA